jgi:hypothetical protein
LEKKPKKRLFSSLSLYGGPPNRISLERHILGVAVAERVSAVRESGLLDEVLALAYKLPRGGHWSKIRARKRD